MYIQITNRCNMRCAHCCFACTEVGEDMTLETWENVKNKILRDEEYAFIGGGEPTLHKYFNTILIECIAICDDVGIVTNGSIKDKAILLAKLTEKGVIHANLSIDDYHDMYMVDEEVISKFESLNAIRSVTRISPAGRALENEEYTEDSGCGCDDIIVKPDGSVYQCNCPDATCFGNVNDAGFILSVENFGCMREIESMKGESEDD